MKIVDAYDKITAPIITEKGTLLSERNQVVFEVPMDVSKPEIKAAVEALFKVKVTAVRTLTVRPKTVRRGKSIGLSAGKKKAFIRVAEGQKLEGV